MEFTIEYGGDGPQDVTVIFSGVATPEGFGRYNAEAAAGARTFAGMAVLIDVSALDTSQMSGDDFQVVGAAMIEREFERQPLAVAYVTSNARTFADAIQFRAHLGGARSRRDVFGSREDAVAWLEEQRRSAER